MGIRDLNRYLKSTTFSEQDVRDLKMARRRRLNRKYAQVSRRRRRSVGHDGLQRSISAPTEGEHDDEDDDDEHSDKIESAKVPDPVLWQAKAVRRVQAAHLAQVSALTMQGTVVTLRPKPIDIPVAVARAAPEHGEDETEDEGQLDLNQQGPGAFFAASASSNARAIMA